MKNKFAAVAAAITMAIGTVAMPAAAEAGDRHERQWRQQQQQQHHHHNHHRQRQRDRGNEVGAVIGGMALGIILGEVLNQGNNGHRVPPVIINPPHGGGVYNGGMGRGPYAGHRERCNNMQEQLDRTAYNMAYDGIDHREMRQIDNQMQRMRNNGCRPYRPF